MCVFFYAHGHVHTSVCRCFMYMCVAADVGPVSGEDAIFCKRQMQRWQRGISGKPESNSTVWFQIYVVQNAGVFSQAPLGRSSSRYARCINMFHMQSV